MQLSGSFNHDDLETVDLIHRESTKGKKKKTEKENQQYKRKTELKGKQEQIEEE